MTLSAAASSRADVSGELAPSVGLGATDNASLASTAGNIDLFATVGVGGNLSVRRPRLEYGLSSSVGFMTVLTNSQYGSATGSLGLSMGGDVVPRLHLSGGADASVSRTTAVGLTTVVDPTTPATVTGVPRWYFRTGAHQDLSWQASQRQTYSQSLRAQHISYLATDTPGPEPTSVALTLGGSWPIGYDAPTLEAGIGDTYTPDYPNMPPSSFSHGDVWDGHIYAGWRHDWSRTWSTGVQAGGLALWKFGGANVVTYGGNVQAGYRSLPWFFNFGVGRNATPNIYLGAVTVSDTVTASAALPLSKDDRWVALGTAGYTYSQLASDSGQLSYGYQQVTGGASMTYTFLKPAIRFSADYSIVKQLGGDAGVPSLMRQTLLLTASGVFAWGRREPSPFPGAAREERRSDGSDPDSSGTSDR